MIKYKKTAGKFPQFSKKVAGFYPQLILWKMNQYLKEISTHCARKTFICFMLSIGIAEKAKTDAMDAMEKALNG